MPTPTPMATPCVGAGDEVGEVEADELAPVGPVDVVVVAVELLVELDTLAVYVAPGSIVVTIVPACRVKTALGSEQLQPLKP